MRPLALVVVVLFFATAWNTAAQEPSPERKKPPATSVTLHVDHNTFKVGTPIILKATLTNQSDHEITTGYDASRGVFVVDVFDQAGKFATDKRPGYHNGRYDIVELSRTWTPEQLFKSGLLTGNLVNLTMKPGGTIEENIEVSKYYDMTTPGVYKIVVESGDPETGSIVKSNPVALTVTKEK